MSKITKGFKFRIYLHERDIELMNMSFGHTRFIYNHLLGTLMTQYDAWKTNPAIYSRPDYSAFALSELITKIKREEDKLWLADVSSTILQQAARDLSSAYGNFFRNLKKGTKPGFPSFKKKHARNSFRLTKGNFHIRETKLILAKFKHPVRVAWSRELPSEPSSVTISRDPDGKYYASFVCEADLVLTNGDKETGIDLGLTDLAVLSNGDRITNPKHYVKSQKKLAYLQRQLSKKKFRSKNRNKARHKVAKLHKKISNQRNNYLHKVSRTLVNENQVLALETLKPSNMVKNRHLAKGISDVSWNTLVKYIVYKARESYRCTIVLMNPLYPSTQLCSSCNTKSEEKIKLSVRKWTCNTCNTKHDRDVNAAMNILNKAKDTLKKVNPSGTWTDKLLIADLERL